MIVEEFAQLCQRYSPEMKAHALRLTKDPDGAKDLFQESVYWIYRNRQQFQPGTNFRAWALAIIRNTFLNGYRMQKRRGELLKAKPIQQEWSTREVTYNPAEGHMGAERIMKVIEELSPIYRQPFLLHYEGLTYKDIALRMGIPVGTAKSRVFTARASLRPKINVLYGIGG